MNDWNSLKGQSVKTLSQIKTMTTVTLQKTQPLTLTIIEMVSRRPDFEASIEAGRVIHDFKSVRILSRVPLAMQAIRNVLKQNPAYRLHDVSAKAYSKEAAEF